MKVNQKGANAMKQLIQAVLKVGSLLLVIVVVISTGCQQQPDIYYLKEYFAG